MIGAAFEQRPDGSQHLYIQGRQFSRASEQRHWRHGRLSERGKRVHGDWARLIRQLYEARHQLNSVYRRPRRQWERKPGQLVSTEEYGLGRIVALVRDKTVIKFGKHERVLAAGDFYTVAQLQADWHSYWLRGEHRRLEEGCKLARIKVMCHHGDWQKFLDRYNYPRSTADDLIRRYRIECQLRAENQMPDNRAFQGDRATDESGGRSKLNQRQPDPDDEERKALVEKERKERLNKQPSHHPGFWSVRITLPPEVVALVRKKYKDAGKRARRFWRRAAYHFIDLTPPK